MKKINPNIWIGIVLVVGLLVLGAVYFSNKNNINILNEKEPVVLEEPQSVQDVDKDVNKVVAAPISYTNALVTYADRKIQLDTECQAHPNNVTYKDNTGIMIDNRSPETRTIKAGVTFTVKPWSFKILVLPNVYLSSKTILVDCDKSQNVATILVQE
jgi:hypothetical protein